MHSLRDRVQAVERELRRRHAAGPAEPNANGDAAELVRQALQPTQEYDPEYLLQEDCSCGAQLEMFEETCTGLSARWCPIHGDCACHGRDNGDLCDPDCPLHGIGSPHADNLNTMAGEL